MATTISRLAIDLLLNSTGLEKGLNQAMKSTRKFGREMTALGKDISLKVTAPLAGVGLASLKVAGDFESGMNRVRAITGATGEQFDALREKAKELGATTQFSATESAAGIEMLAKNGLQYEQIVSGALDATLKLSAATGSELSRAADIGTDAMMAFNIEAKNMEQAVNAITGVTLNSKFDIEAYALALANGGAVAGSVGVSFEEFNASLAAIAPSFSSGMTAGTAFKTFLTRLQPTSGAAEQAMKKLGLEFFDASGNMKNMADIAGQLQTAFQGLSEAERIDMAKDMFGTEGMQAAFALAAAGREEILRLNDAINNTSAADQAAARLEGLNGALTKMRSALEAAGIAIAESGLLEWSTRLVETLTGLIGSLAKSNPAILGIGTVAALAAASAGPLLLVIGQMATGMSAVLALIGGKAGLMTALAALTGPIGLTIAAVAALTVAYITFKDEIDAFLGGVWKEMVAGWEAIPEIIDAAGIVLSNYFQQMQADFERFLADLGALKSALSAWIAGQAETLAGWVADWSRTGKRIILVVQQMIVSIEGWLIDKFNAIADKAAKITGRISDSFRWLKDKVVGNSWVPDMVDGIEAETRRLQNVFQNPIETQNQELSQSYQKLAAEVSNITLEPKTAPPVMPDSAQDLLSATPKAVAPAHTVIDNPFVFGVSDRTTKAIQQSIQEPFANSIGRPRFQTQSAEKALAQAADTIAQSATKPIAQTVGQIYGYFDNLGNGLADSILRIGDTLKDGQGSFLDFGSTIGSVVDDVLKAFKNLNAPSLNTGATPKAVAPAHTVIDNPFVFGVSDRTTKAIQQSIQEPFANSIGRPRFQTQSAEKALAQAADTIAQSATKPIAQTVGQIYGYFDNLGNGLADSILRIGDTLKDGQGSFLDFGSTIGSVVDDVLKAFKNLNAPSLNTGDSLLSLLGGTIPGFGGAGGSQSFNPLGLLGSVFTPNAGGNPLEGILGGISNIFSPAAQAAPQGGGGLFGSILGGIGSLFGGFFADGGNPPIGKVSVVGEDGPELIVPRTSSTVVPLQQVASTSGNNQQTITLHVEQNNQITTNDNPEDLERRLADNNRQLTQAILDMVERGGRFRAAFTR